MKASKTYLSKFLQKGDFYSGSGKMGFHHYEKSVLSEITLVEKEPAMIRRIPGSISQYDDIGPPKKRQRIEELGLSKHLESTDMLDEQLLEVNPEGDYGAEEEIHE